MRQIDTTFSNDARVRRALLQRPKMLEFGGMSREVRDFYLDMDLHSDAFVGYTSWYLRKKKPPVSERAFLPDDIWKRIEFLEMHYKSDADIIGVKGAKELIRFIETLTDMMFVKLGP